MENVLLKARIASLWTFMIFILLGLQRLGDFPLQATPISLILSTVGSLILFIIPFLCLTLKDSMNRMANIILGIAFTVFGIAGTSSALMQMTASDAYLGLMYGAATVAPAVIVYYAYRWPRE